MLPILRVISSPVGACFLLNPKVFWAMSQGIRGLKLEAYPGFTPNTFRSNIPSHFGAGYMVFNKLSLPTRLECQLPVEELEVKNAVAK